MYHNPNTYNGTIATQQSIQNLHGSILKMVGDCNNQSLETIVASLYNSEINNGQPHQTYINALNSLIVTHSPMGIQKEAINSLLQALIFREYSYRHIKQTQNQNTTPPSMNIETPATAPTQNQK